MILNESYNSDNFFKNTKAKFVEVERPKREADYISRDKYGFFSSAYWYDNDGVYRFSQHWSRIYLNGEYTQCIENAFSCGNVSSCYWELYCKDENCLCGFCKWEDFSINDVYY